MQSSLWSWASRNRASDDKVRTYAPPPLSDPHPSSPRAYSDPGPGFCPCESGGTDSDRFPPWTGSNASGGSDHFKSQWGPSPPWESNHEAQPYRKDAHDAPWTDLFAKRGGPYDGPSSLPQGGSSKLGHQPAGTPWKVSSYPSYHQVPSISQGSTEQTGSSLGGADSAAKVPPRDWTLQRSLSEGMGAGPRLEPSAVLSLKAAATNRYKSKGGGDDKEVSSMAWQQDQVAPVLTSSSPVCSPVLSDPEGGYDWAPRLRTRGQPLFSGGEWGVPPRGEPFHGATKIRLERHLSSGRTSPGSDPLKGFGSVGQWALEHVAGAIEKQTILSLCAINPAYFPEGEGSELRGTESLRSDALVPDMDVDVTVGGGSESAMEESWGVDSLKGVRSGTFSGGERLSPRGFKKRQSFDEQDGPENDRAQKMRKSAEFERDVSGVGRVPGDRSEYSAQRELERIWGLDSSCLQPTPSLELRGKVTPRGGVVAGVEQGEPGVRWGRTGGGPLKSQTSPIFNKHSSGRSFPLGVSDLTPRARSASPRLQITYPVSRAAGTEREVQSPSRFSLKGARRPTNESARAQTPPKTARETPPPRTNVFVARNPGGFSDPSRFPAKSLPKTPVMESYFLRTDHEVAYIATRGRHESWTSGGSFLGPNNPPQNKELVRFAREDTSPTSSSPREHQTLGLRDGDTWTPSNGDTCVSQESDTCCQPMDVSGDAPGTFDERAEGLRKGALTSGARESAFTSERRGGAFTPEGRVFTPEVRGSAVRKDPGWEGTEAREDVFGSVSAGVVSAEQGVLTSRADGGALTPGQEGQVADYSSSKRLESQASLSHWASLTLDLECLKDGASPDDNSSDGGVLSPFRLPPCNRTRSPSTSPNLSPRTFVPKPPNKQPGAAIIPSGVKTKGCQRIPGIKQNIFEEIEEGLEPMDLNDDVTSLLSVLRGGLKRQKVSGLWSLEERNAVKTLAEATRGSEQTVQRVKQAGGLSLLIKILNSGDDAMIESAADVISHCNGAFQAKPIVKSFDFANGVTVSVRETPYAETGLGCKVWKAAVVLGDLLAADPPLVAGKRVLEIGSGCGLCGFLATKLGAQEVTLTDNSEPLLVSLRESVLTHLCEAAPPTEPKKDNPNAFLNGNQSSQGAANQRHIQTTSSTALSGEQTRFELPPPLAIPPPILTSSKVGFGDIGTQGLGVGHSDPRGSGLREGLGVGQSIALNEGPDQARRARLQQTEPESPTTAFNGLSFRSPPLGPQPFVPRKPPPQESEPASGALTLERSDDRWDICYGAGSDNGLGPAATVRVRQLEWEDDAAALANGKERLGKGEGTGVISDSDTQVGDQPPKLTADEVFDVIVGSDCLYSTAAIDSLSAVIKRRMAWPFGKCILVSAVRDTEMFDDFKQRLHGRGLDVNVTKLDEETLLDRGLGSGGTFHDASYYAGGFSSMHIMHKLN